MSQKLPGLNNTILVLSGNVPISSEKIPVSNKKLPTLNNNVLVSSEKFLVSGKNVAVSIGKCQVLGLQFAVWNSDDEALRLNIRVQSRYAEVLYLDV